MGVSALRGNWRKGAWAAAAALAALVCVAVARYLETEALLEGHYPLRSVAPHAVETKATLARGAHLIRIFGCADCHGADLRGRMVYRGGAGVFASDLRALPKDYSDEDFARAVRFGLNPDGTSLWLMPSASFVYLSGDDMDAILATVDSLPRDAQFLNRPRFAGSARQDIRAGTIVPAAVDALSDESSMDLGPRWSGGRYLARTSCSECHGLDLAGSDDGRVPGLDGVKRYSLRQFFALVHDGRLRDGRYPPGMTAPAHARFRYFADYETMALYDYLWTRGWMSEVTLR